MKNSTCLVLLFICAFCLFSPTISYEFTRDDNPRILQNNFIDQIDKLPIGIVSPTWPGNLYRPIPFVFDNLLYSFFGPNPIPFHLFSVFLHALTGVALLSLLLKITNQKIALLAAFLFVLHPVHSETVANISCKSEILVAFFGLLAINFSLISAQLSIARCFQIGLLLLASFLSKESGLVFCLLLPLTLSLFKKLDIKILITIFLSALIYLIIRSLVLFDLQVAQEYSSNIDNILIDVSTIERIYTATLLLGKYLYTYCLPINLSSDYSFGQIATFKEWPFKETLTYLIFLIGIILIISRNYNKSKLIVFSGLWFFIGFMITANVFFPIGTIFAERLLYLPSIGLALLAAKGLVKVRTPILITFFLLINLATLNNLARWKNLDHLIASDILVAPKSSRVQHTYAQYLYGQKKYSEAIKHAKESLRISPEYLGAKKLLQALYLKNKQFELAESLGLELLEIEPNDLKILNACGWATLNLGKYQDSYNYFTRALAVSPEFALSKIGIFALAVESGDYQAAKTISQELPTEFRNFEIYKMYAQKIDLIK